MFPLKETWRPPAGGQGQEVTTTTHSSDPRTAGSAYAPGGKRSAGRRGVINAMTEMWTGAAGVNQVQGLRGSATLDPCLDSALPRFTVTR